MRENELLSVENLEVKYFLRNTTVEAVNGVSFTIDKGERVGLVGETGAGKTTTALSILCLIPDPPGKITNGTIVLNGENLMETSEKELQKIRGNDVAMIFQDPMTSLNPRYSRWRPDCGGCLPPWRHKQGSGRCARHGDAGAGGYPRRSL